MSQTLPNTALALGREWVVEAFGCNASWLRDVVRLRALVEAAIGENDLHPIALPFFHVFPGEGGVTAMVALAESHMALHTFPEHGALTMNLYCCRERRAWPYAERLREAVGATDVRVRVLTRGKQEGA